MKAKTVKPSAASRNAERTGRKLYEAVAALASMPIGDSITACQAFRREAEERGSTDSPVDRAEWLERASLTILHKIAETLDIPVYFGKPFRHVSASASRSV